MFSYALLILMNTEFLINKFFCMLFFIVSDVSSLVFNLEDNLPDDLISNNSWGDNLGANKPTIQLAGPPGNNQQQINGDDSIGVPNVGLQRQHQRPTGTFILHFKTFSCFLKTYFWIFLFIFFCKQDTHNNCIT